jgi:hypothetical protein
MEQFGSCPCLWFRMQDFCSRSGSQRGPEKPKINDNVHKTQTLTHLLSQKNPVHTLTTCAFKIHFNIVTQSSGAHGSLVGLGTVLQVGRSRVRYPITSLMIQFTLSFQSHYALEFTLRLTDISVRHRKRKCFCGVERNRHTKPTASVNRLSRLWDP